MAAVSKSTDRSRSCSIVIPAFNRYELTVNCIRSVRENTRAGTYTLIVVDNGSTDATACLESADIIVHWPENRGFAKACNFGADVVREAKSIVFLNNDTEVAPGWLPALRKSLAMPKAGIAGSFMHYPGGATQHAGIDFIQSPPIVATNIQELMPPGYVPAVSGACMAVRREVWDQLNGFNEAYWNGYEDVDLCLRAQDVGWKTYYDPASQVMHLESQSGPERFAQIGNNMELLQKLFSHLVTAQEGTDILIPAMRAHKLKKLVDTIEQTTPERHSIHFMVTRGSDCHEVLGKSNDLYTVHLDNGDTWGHRLNAMYRKTKESYLFLGSDDSEFCIAWLREALATMGNMQGVVSVNDGVQPEGTLALVSRQYIDQLSGCFDTPNVIIYPGYHHNYSETELFQTARRRHRFAYARTSMVRHMHPINGSAPPDEVYALGNEHSEEDAHLHFERANRLWRMYQ